MKTNLSALLLILATGSAYGQRINPVAPAKGAYSVGFSVDWIKEHGSTGSIFTVTPAYFVTDRLEVRVPLLFDRSNGANETIFGLGARWHFAQRHDGRLSVIDPFIGLVDEHATAARFREDFLGAQLGVHYFIANNVAITTLLTVGNDRTNGVTENTTHLTTGLSIFFAGK